MRAALSRDPIAWIVLVAVWALVSAISILPLSPWSWRAIGPLPFIWWGIAAVCLFFAEFAFVNSQRATPLKGPPVSWAGIILVLAAGLGLVLGSVWG